MSNKSPILTILGVGLFSCIKKMSGSKNKIKSFKKLKEDYINIRIESEYSGEYRLDNLKSITPKDTFTSEKFRYMVVEFNKVNNNFLQKISNIDILQNFNSGADIHQYYMKYLKHNIPDDVFYSDFNLVNDYLNLIKEKQKLRSDKFYRALSEYNNHAEQYADQGYILIEPNIQDLLFPTFPFEIYIEEDSFKDKGRIKGKFIIEASLTKYQFDKIIHIKNKHARSSFFYSESFLEEIPELTFLPSNTSLKEDICNIVFKSIVDLLVSVFNLGSENWDRVVDLKINEDVESTRCEVWTKGNNKFIENAIIYKPEKTELRKF